MKIKNLESDSRSFVEELGCFKVLEHFEDKSTTPYYAQMEYFMAEMNIHKRQVMCYLKDNRVVVQKGAMQWYSGDIEVTTGVKGAGDLAKKFLKSKVTGESAIKPEYAGSGILMLEPTYRFIILEDIGEWAGGMTIEDGMFLACEASVQQSVVARSNLSSAALGGEGLFNTSLSGQGIACLESYVPRDELIEIQLNNDELKIDGNMAVAWSSNLQFTVERTTKTLIGSAASGEGLVNVYRGTGKVLMSPVASTGSSGYTQMGGTSGHGTSAPTSKGANALGLISAAADLMS